jgi:hypothetical protein
VYGTESRRGEARSSRDICLGNRKVGVYFPVISFFCERRKLRIEESSKQGKTRLRESLHSHCSNTWED